MDDNHLVNIIMASGVASDILAEVAPADIPNLISKPSGMLITTDVSFLKPFIAYKAELTALCNQTSCYCAPR